MNWNTDISKAPRGKTVETTVITAKGPRPASRFIPVRVILATKCGKVVLSHFIPDDEGRGRWQMLAKREEPLAWMAWPEFPQSATTRGESDAKSAHRPDNEKHLIVGRRQGVIAGQQPQQETVSDQAPSESAAVEISRPISHSLPVTSTGSDQPHGVSPSAPCGSQLHGAS